MRPVPLALSVAVTGALLLTACGSQRAGAGGPGTGRAAASPGADDPSCGTSTAPSAAASADPGGQGAQDTDGVRLVGAAGCPAFEVTNDTGRNATFTITYQRLSASGAALSSARQTVSSVAPGRTVRRAVAPDAPDASVVDAQDATHVRIIKVRSVPTAEAPARTGPCPPSGVRVYADDGDAAMGLRVVGLHLENCGTRAYPLDGYPRLRLLDQRHEPVDSVRVLHGGAAIATGTGADAAPRPLVLAPGESAHAGLVWRNTTGSGDPVDAPYVRVVAKPGAAAVTVTPELDLGTTGRLGVGAWEKDRGTEAGRGGSGRPGDSPDDGPEGSTSGRTSGRTNPAERPS
ncbi:DUF4232 domain-containing protein [Streptomyces sp. NPDC047017]|uniref:DUF4232 domain-containing protein n=1 Tax=Streptomyces sp. NPDC047017 TaxID=3155024 RepID=UPI00340F75D5